MLEHPDMREWTRRQWIDQVHAFGGCVVQCHPFRQALYMNHIAPCLGVDGVEVYNSGNRPEWDALALRYARRMMVMLKYLWKIAVIALLLGLILVLAPAPYAIFDAYAEIIELPIDIKEGGLPFKWENYTSDTHYEDPSIMVDIVWGGRIHDTNYVYALIKIANATQLRSALSNDNFKDWKTYGHKIAKAKNAVFAVNGDFCKAKDYRHGYIVREGHLYRDRPSKTCLGVITSHPGFERIAGMRAQKTTRLYNGRLECAFMPARLPGRPGRVRR